jgi:hypothetical protein
MQTVRDRNVPRRGVLWFGAVTLGLITAFMSLVFSQSGWTTASMAFVAICTVATFGLVLTLVNASRFAWGIRIVTFLMFVTFFWSLISASFIHRAPLHAEAAGEPSALDAIRGFLFFGLPSLIYTLWGSTWGKVGLQNPERPTRADVAVLRLAIYGRWAFLVLTLVAAVAAYLRLTRQLTP